MKKDEPKSKEESKEAKEKEVKDGTPIQRRASGNVASLVQRISTYGIPAGGIGLPPQSQPRASKKSASFFISNSNSFYLFFIIVLFRIAHIKCPYYLTDQRLKHIYHSRLRWFLYFTIVHHMVKSFTILCFGLCFDGSEYSTKSRLNRWQLWPVVGSSSFLIGS